MSPISAKTKLCVIIGNPVEHSLSPKMHNAAYEALGIDHELVFTAAKVKVEDVKTVVEAVRVMGIRGLTCTIPHKMEVMKYLDWIDEKAKKIGAVNTVVNDNGVLKGYNTDLLGVTIPIERVIPDLRGKKVAVIGAGGAARAMIHGVMMKCAMVKVFNRAVENAQTLATEFGCEAGGLDELAEVSTYDVVMNSTSLGMGEQEGETPVPQAHLRKGQVAFDAVYVPYETRFLREAKEKGAHIIHGMDMLLYQGTAQFELYTNHKAPEEVMKKALGL